MSDLLRELYQEIILDHGNTPRNFGECEHYNKSADGHNSLCGDKVHLTSVSYTHLTLPTKRIV